MNLLDRQSSARAPLIAAAGVLVALTALLLTQPVLAQLPPRPGTPVPGGVIELRAEFPADWPWEEAHWQEVLTVVQWQDVDARWHDVEGWRGAPDDIEIGQGGTVAGRKAWWVAEKDLGTGPFRWQVYYGEDGDVLGVTDAFTLPLAAGAVERIDVSLGLP